MKVFFLKKTFVFFTVTICYCLGHCQQPHPVCRTQEKGIIHRHLTRHCPKLLNLYLSNSSGKYDSILYTTKARVFVIHWGCDDWLVLLQELTQKLQNMRFSLQLVSIEDQRTPILHRQNNLRCVDKYNFDLSFCSSSIVSGVFCQVNKGCKSTIRSLTATSK